MDKKGIIVMVNSRSRETCPWAAVFWKDPRR